MKKYRWKRTYKIQRDDSRSVFVKTAMTNITRTTSRCIIIYPKRLRGIWWKDFDDNLGNWTYIGQWK